MKRAILVDDEYVIRKGLLYILPWEKYGIRVVADFESGEQALVWLERNEVELIVTDLTMPGISGFELIERARSVRPGAEAAILTCHQDFQYIQEALRMGALDYIVKTELDDDKLDSLFRRIAQRLDEKEEQALLAGGHAKRTLYLLTGLQQDCKPAELLDLTLEQNSKLEALQKNVWYFVSEHARLIERLPAALENRWRMFCLRHYGNPPAGAANGAALLKEYVNRHAFYEADPRAAVVHEEYDRLAAWAERKRDEIAWLGCWQQFDWLYDESNYAALLDAVEQNRPAPRELTAEMTATVRAWKSISCVSEEAGRLERDSEGLAGWHPWRLWLDGVRTAIGKLTSEAGIDRYLMVKIFRVAEWSRRNLNKGITQEEAARTVHLSRGYFSECFKRCAGATYHDFIRRLRIERAKELILTTDLAVWDVAIQCGISDEAYFRKLFRQETGLSPRAYKDAGLNKSCVGR